MKLTPGSGEGWGEGSKSHRSTSVMVCTPTKMGRDACAETMHVTITLGRGENAYGTKAVPFEQAQCYILASVPGLPRYVRVLICGGGDNAVKTEKAWAD